MNILKEAKSISFFFLSSAKNIMAKTEPQNFEAVMCNLENIVYTTSLFCPNGVLKYLFVCLEPSELVLSLFIRICAFKVCGFSINMATKFCCSSHLAFNFNVIHKKVVNPDITKVMTSFNCSQVISDNDVRKIVLLYLVHNCFKETAETFLASTEMEQPIDYLVDMDKRKCRWLLSNNI